MNTMKCDMDLVRDIMLFAENFDPADYYDEATREGTRHGSPQYADFPQYADTVSEHEFATTHLMLHNEQLLTTKSYRGYLFTDPTWAGHHFLSEIRDPKWFAKIKKHIGDKHWCIKTIRATHTQLRKNADQIFVFWLTAGLTTGFWWLFGAFVSFFAWLCGFFG